MGPLWQILWVLAALVTGAVMLGAWNGPHRSVSNLSRWAIRLRVRPVPAWLSNRGADRWAFRGGLVVLVLLVAAAWLVPSSQELPETPAGVPDSSQWPATPEASTPGRHIDTELKNAILVHVPKTKKIRVVVLKDDEEANQFSWEVDAFLRTEGYTVTPRLMFAMPKGEPTPSGTAIYPDQKDPEIVIIRIGLDDRR